MKAGSEKKTEKNSPEIAPEFKDLAPPGEDPKDQKIIEMRKAGKNYRQITRELGVGQQRIAAVLADAGLLGEQKKREEVKKTMLLFDDETTLMFIRLPFDYLAKRYGDFWRLSKDEENKLAVLSNRLASKYLPLWLERYADEVALIFTVASISYPRYLQTKQLIEEKAQKEKDQGQKQGLEMPKAA